MSYVIILTFLVNFMVKFSESKQGVVIIGKPRSRSDVQEPPPPPLTMTTMKPISCPVTYHSFRCEPNTVLNFTGTRVMKIGDYFVNSTDTKELYLDYNDINEISPKAFEALPSLRILSLRGNHIAVSQLLRFKQHNTLESLILDENRYNDDEMVLGSMLESLPKLRYLSLRRSSIHRVDVSIRKFAPRLVHLDLSGNDIASTDFLKNLPSTVENLFLDDNGISTLTSFGLENVKVLSLSGNNFTVLCGSDCSDSGLSLEGMTNLKTLNGSRNKIHIITINAFLNMRSLRTLDLSENNIDTLPNDAFNAMKSLNELRLSRNKFVYVPNMCQLESIRHVDLSWNKIQEITTRSFCATPCFINSINLAGNRISNINDQILRNLNRLERLDLSNNHIGIFPTQLITTAQSLRVLLLKSNRITNIDQLFYTRSTQLTELHLQDNPLPSLKVHVILPMLTIHLKDFNPIREEIKATTMEASSSNGWSNNDDNGDSNTDSNDGDYKDVDNESNEDEWP